MTSAKQLTFDLPHRDALGREDFVVGQCNEEAVAVIDRWPDWPANRFLLLGPAGSGKSHLAAVWRTRSHAAHIRAADLAQSDISAALAKTALLIEDGHSLGDERPLFHLLNGAAEARLDLLITADRRPALWAITDPGLLTRLQSMPVVSLEAPSYDVLGHVLKKLFSDRQLAVEDDVIAHLLVQMERSFEAARRIVAALDSAALHSHRRISKRLVNETLQSQNDAITPPA